MNSDITLTHRQQEVLRATVRHYVATAEPVGSKTLLEEYKLKVSPATIRSAMSFLEKAGLLYQPHTSAGRVPSDFGYRIYVDHLLTPVPEVAQQVVSFLQQRLHQQEHILELLLRGAAQILASLSGYVILITPPQPYPAYLRHLQLLQVDPGHLLVILVTDTYETHSCRLALPATLATAEPQSLGKELELLANFLNLHLRSKALTEMGNLDWGMIDREFSRYGELLHQLLGELVQRHQAPAQYTQILVSGLAEVLRQPEFAAGHQLQTMLHLLEGEQEQIWPLITSPSRPGVRVWIGAENPLEPMQNFALISASYQRGGLPGGSVGMLGPTRMLYEQAIATVEGAATYLSTVLS